MEDKRVGDLRDVRRLVAVRQPGPPTARPVTSPVALTVATCGSLVVQVIRRPGRGSPCALFGVAVSCWVSPTVTLVVVGVTLTDATGTELTLIVAVPLFPSLAAVMATGPPVATPITSPVALTVATPTLLLVHVTVRPGRGFPALSFAVAMSCTVSPTAMPAVAGVTVTDATGTGFTVIVAVALCFPLVAVMITGPPAAAPVTSPVAFTGAPSRCWRSIG